VPLERLARSVAPFRCVSRSLADQQQTERAPCRDQWRRELPSQRRSSLALLARYSIRVAGVHDSCGAFTHGDRMMRAHSIRSDSVQMGGSPGSTGFLYTWLLKAAPAPAYFVLAEFPKSSPSPSDRAFAVVSTNQRALPSV
jgi:hypothetical protein